MLNFSGWKFEIYPEGLKVKEDTNDNSSILFKIQSSIY